MAERKQAFIVEQQTGRAFEIKEEKKGDRIVARLSVIYLILMLLFFLWQLFDIWVGKRTLFRIFGYSDLKDLTSAPTMICIYTFIGGALGAIVNEIRGVLFWHCDQEAYGRRYIWKSLIAPFLGGTLGIFVYFLMRSGIALFTGEFIPSQQSVQQGVPMFALGVLAGYGGRKVFIWLDYQVARIFKLKKERTDNYKSVPDLMGLSEKEAEKNLKDVDLVLGEVSSAPTPQQSSVGKVINQKPKPKVSLARGATVDITVGSLENNNKKDAG
jgi:hypothetical protein